MELAAERKLEQPTRNAAAVCKDDDLEAELRVTS
jgi:hypothetical protein